MEKGEAPSEEVNLKSPRKRSAHVGTFRYAVRFRAGRCLKLFMFAIHAGERLHVCYCKFVILKNLDNPCG